MGRPSNKLVLIGGLILLLLLSSRQFNIRYPSGNLDSPRSSIDSEQSLEDGQITVKIADASPKKITPEALSKQESARDKTYYGLSAAEKFSELQRQMQLYINKEVTCETKFISTILWCDSNPGNGMKSFLKALALGFILDRLPLVSVYRKSNCEGHFLDFRKPGLLIEKEKRHEKLFQEMKCSSAPTYLKIGSSRSYACDSIGNRSETFVEMTDPMWDDVSRLSDLQFNPSLTEEQRIRLGRVLDIGFYTTVGMLTDLVLDISEKVKQQFRTDYYPGETILQRLIDPSVLKVGIHVRHLPFVVRDEGGSGAIDKRALKCLGQSLQSALSTGTGKYNNGCLILVATDMMASRDQFAKQVKQLNTNCETLVVKRTANNSEEWGATSYSDWEKRDPGGDRRGMLEAYLDYFVLSEYSDFFVFSAGSTFSQLIAFRNAKRPTVTQNVEFSCSSCKENYLPFACCFTRKRWDEGILITRYSNLRCT